MKTKTLNKTNKFILIRIEYVHVTNVCVVKNGYIMHTEMTLVPS